MTSSKRLVLSYAKQEDLEPGTRSSLAIRFSSGEYERLVRFECSGAALSASGDALLCLGLVPAMELGVDLKIDAEVDAELLDHARDTQALLCAWYPGYRTVSIDARVTRRTYPEGRGTGLFFSGGVDSGFSLATERGRISRLVTIIGADVDPADTLRVAKLEAAARDVAARFGVQPILVTTDIRAVSDRLIGWVEYHGALLAAVRHMLAHELENQLIASSADESSWNRRWGSHPALDRLWGTTGAKIEHHGLVHRLAKIDRISCEPVLMEHLAVCARSSGNCGVCDKCQFMLAALDLLDARDKAPTYRHAVSRERKLRVTGEGSLSDMVKLRAAAAADGRHEDIVAAVDRALARYRRKKSLQKLLPVSEIARRFKRFKRQVRFMRQAGRSKR
jgi:hypothetical protein